VGTWVATSEDSGTRTDGGPLQNWAFNDGARLHLEVDGTAHFESPFMDATSYRNDPELVAGLASALEASSGGALRAPDDAPVLHKWESKPWAFVITVQGKLREYRRVAEGVVEWTQTTSLEWKGKPTTVVLIKRWRHQLRDS
jgi:hypothetical protein